MVTTSGWIPTLTPLTMGKMRLSQDARQPCRTPMHRVRNEATVLRTSETALWFRGSMSRVPSIADKAGWVSFERDGRVREL